MRGSCHSAWCSVHYHDVFTRRGIGLRGTARRCGRARVRSRRLPENNKKGNLLLNVEYIFNIDVLSTYSGVISGGRVKNLDFQQFI